MSTKKLSGDKVIFIIELNNTFHVKIYDLEEQDCFNGLEVGTHDTIEEAVLDFKSFN